MLTDGRILSRRRGGIGLYSLVLSVEVSEEEVRKKQTCGTGMGMPDPKKALLAAGA